MKTRGFDWVCRTIDTCNNVFQLETAERIIENFKRSSSNKEEIEFMNSKFMSKARQLNYYDCRNEGCYPTRDRSIN